MNPKKTGGGGGAKAADKTQEYADALIETIASAEEGEDPKQIAWNWMHQYEPLFKQQGIDANILWQIYERTASNKAAQASSGGGGSGLNYLKKAGEILPKVVGAGPPGVNVLDVLRQLRGGQ